MSERSTRGVSVLMPVHNGGHYLQAAVDSILRQTYSHYELIVIDDHSTDRAIAQLAKHTRIRHYKSPDRGIVAALNFGLSQARYSYIARMDADDLAAPDRLATQLDHLTRHPEIDICGTQVELFRDDGAVAGGYRHYQEWINQQCTPEQIARSFFVESCIPHPSAMMHRSVLESLGGYQDSSWPEDYDLWCRAHLAGFRFGKPENQILLQWRDHDTRTSRVEQRYAKQQFLRCKAHYLSKLLTANGIQRCVVWGTGPTGAKMHDYLEQNQVRVTGFVDINPRLKGREKRGKPIHLVSLQPTIDELDVMSPFGIVAVSARGAREQIKTALLAAGLAELSDFILAA